MPFKIKDLLIDIEAAEAKELCSYQTRMCREPTAVCPVPSNYCRYPSCPLRTFRTCPLHTCPKLTNIPVEEDWRTPFEEAELGELRTEDLGALKKRLEQALEVVKAKHAELEAGGVREPRTHEEIDALESKLEDALKDLRARRAKLRGAGQ